MLLFISSARKPDREAKIFQESEIYSSFCRNYGIQIIENDLLISMPLLPSEERSHNESVKVILV